MESGFCTTIGRAYLLRKALQILACLAVSTHIIYLLCMWGIAIAMFSMLSRQSMKAAMREHRVSLLMCQKIKQHLLLTLDCLFKVSTVIPMLTDPETHPFASWGLQAF